MEINFHDSLLWKGRLRACLSGGCNCNRQGEMHVISLAFCPLVWLACLSWGCRFGKNWCTCLTNPENRGILNTVLCKACAVLPENISCGRGETGRHDRFRFYCFGVQVQVLSSAPKQNAQKWRKCVVSERFSFFLPAAVLYLSFMQAVCPDSPKSSTEAIAADAFAWAWFSSWQ